MLRRKIILATQFLAVGLVVGGVTASWASPQNEMPQLVNAKQETRAASQNLGATVTQIASESANAGWIGYSVDAVAGEGRVCCENYRGNYDQGCGTCRLENDHNGFTTKDSSGTVAPERPKKLVVLLRVADRHVMRVRVASNNCTLDAGGLHLVWLTGVKADESVALLAKYVHTDDFQGEGDHGTSQQALLAIALHADAAADRAFASFIAPAQPTELRRQAAFWLGAARGKSGLELLQRMAKSDPSSDVRAHVTFALSVSKEPTAVDEMIRMAREDESAHVRSQALFWLAHKAGKKASVAITGAIEDDPDTEVKKKAVFALSLMPKDEGVPKLIEVAQTNRNPEVRKQAMFWLGQSNDPRALAFFAKILTQ